jgi:hypothetical protein
MPTAYYQKVPVAGPGKALFVVGSTLKFGRRLKLGGLSLLRFVEKLSAFRHCKNEEKERTYSKGILRGGLRTCFFIILCRDSKLICGLRTHIRASESGARSRTV